MSHFSRPEFEGDSYILTNSAPLVYQKDLVTCQKTGHLYFLSTLLKQGLAYLAKPNWLIDYIRHVISSQVSNVGMSVSSLVLRNTQFVTVF
jgi:hypothetical protein